MKVVVKSGQKTIFWKKSKIAFFHQFDFHRFYLDFDRKLFDSINIWLEFIDDFLPFYRVQYRTFERTHWMMPPMRIIWLAPQPNMHDNLFCASLASRQYWILFWKLHLGVFLNRAASYSFALLSLSSFSLFLEWIALIVNKYVESISTCEHQLWKMH